MTNDERDQYIRRTHDKVTVIETNCTARCKLLDRHDKTLYGNGWIGLTTKVHLLMWVLGVTVPAGVAVLVALAVKAWAGGG